MLSLVTIYWFYSKLHTIKTEFQVLVRMLIKIQICRLPERIQSVFSHIVRKDSSNLPKPSPQCQMVRLHKYYVISLTIITLLSSLYSRVRTMVQYLHTYRTTLSLRLIKIQICRLPERIQSVFSHIVRKDSSNLPKPSPQCQMVGLHKYYVFFSKYYYSTL